MEKLIISSIPTIMLIVGCAMVIGIVVIWKVSIRKYKNPLTIKLLRAPGESLQREMDDLNIDIMGLLLGTVVCPLLFVSLHLSESYLGGMPETLLRFIFNMSAMLFITIYCAYKLIGKLKKRENLRLGFDAERATGQELNRLLVLGYRVYHDIPCDKFNIDHVAVGPTGVYVIETKGRSKRYGNKGNNKATVTYDGLNLIFPTWTEDEPIKQSKRNANWLSKKLSAAIGELVEVQPVLSISGWYIERKSNAKPFIYNGKNPENMFPKIKGQNLSEKMISRITYQIEQWVNDVQPKAYKSVQD